MFYTIYKITNKLNNKFYIGKHQTENLDDGYMGSGKALKSAIKKYGIENFTKEILHVFDNEEEMNQKEKELVVIGESSYNLCEGGKGGFGYINKSRTVEDWFRLHSLGGKSARPFLGKKHSEETKKLIREKIKGRKPSFLGKKHSEETKKLISKNNSSNHLGNKNFMFGKIWIHNDILKLTKIVIKSEKIEDGWNKGRKFYS